MAAPYAYAAEPKAVAGAPPGAAGGRKKYRSPVTPVGGEVKEQFTATTAFGKSGANIMADRRVRRGVTCPPKTRPLPTFGPQITQAPAAPKQPQAAPEPGPMAKLQDEETRPKTPEPVPGRVHAGAQTRKYIEHLTAKPKTKNFSTQTDPAKDYPVPPVFNHRTWLVKPDDPNAAAAANGDGVDGTADGAVADGGAGAGAGAGLKFEPKSDAVDVWTLIEQPTGLFDFDVSAEPIVHVLMEKTLEQALQEVCEEEEAKVMAAHASAFAQQRTAEVSEAARLLAAEQRKLAERARRRHQAVDDGKARGTAQERAAAAEAAKHFIARVNDAVLARLDAAALDAQRHLSEGGSSSAQGAVGATTGLRLVDPTRAQVDDVFVPWALERVAARLQTVSRARATVDAVLLRVVDDLRKQHAAAYDPALASAAGASSSSSSSSSLRAQLRDYIAAEDAARIPKPDKPFAFRDRRPLPASEQALLPLPPAPAVPVAAAEPADE